MKEVIIKSKIVGKEGAIGGGKPIAFPDLSAYALRSDFIRLESSFNDFLEGDDTDNVINRWKELEAFLNNISEDYNLLSLLNGKADKATTLSGYGITDAYTKTNVDDLLKAYVTLGGTQTITGEKNFTGGLKVNGGPIYYDSTKKYWKLEGDLLVTGGVTMYGSDSSFTPSTIMDAIAVDGTTISKSGGILKVIGGTGGGVADSVAWANITGKPTWIGSSKPSYSYSEITGAISTTELQNYLTSNSYLNVTGGDNRYLKLSGGTITGNVTLKAALYGENYISWKNPETAEGGYFYGTSFNASKNYVWTNSLFNWNVDTGVIDFRKTPTINGDSVWHSGNDGSGSGLDADLLDGKQPSELNVGSATQLMINYSYNQDINYPLVFTSRDNIGVAKNGGMYIDYYGRPTYNPKTDTLIVGNLSGNASSATKLQTARTIWGQSFDGTGNVDGTMTGLGSILGFNSIRNSSDVNQTHGIWVGNVMSSSFVNTDLVYNATKHIFLGGNVGIGATSLSAKLHVSGDILATSSIRTNSHLTADGQIYVAGSVFYGSGSEGIYIHGTGINFHSSSNGWIASCVTFDRNGNMNALHNLLVNGGITMYSDQRKKTILNHVELSLKQIADAPLIEHYYNSDDKKTTHVGSIAQYWAEMNDWFCKLDSEGYYTMEIQNAALASAISIARELERYETTTDKAIKTLKKRICELEEEVEQLKSA